MSYPSAVGKFSLAILFLILLCFPPAVRQADAAESSFNLFGIFKGKASKHTRRSRAGQYNSSPFFFSWGAPKKRKPRLSAKVRTMCVRSCDGYYFPVSDATNIKNLRRDQESCQSGCSTEAQLYYYRPSSKNGTDIENMVNLQGQAYGSHENAFLYRKKYISSCSCKPHPWEDEAKARHQAYHDEETEPRYAALPEPVDGTNQSVDPSQNGSEVTAHKVLSSNKRYRRSRRARTPRYYSKSRRNRYGRYNRRRPVGGRVRYRYR